MKWVSALSERARLSEAVAEAALRVRAGLGGATPDLVVAFASPDHRDGWAALPKLLAEALGGGLVLGCSAGGVVGAGREVEHRVGLSVTAAVLPGVRLYPFHLDAAASETPEVVAEAIARAVPQAPGEAPSFVVLPDPMSFDPQPLLGALDRAFPGATVVGGLVSGGRQLGAHALFLGAETHTSGLVGVALTGDVRVDAVVAQGCRPIGEPMFVTAGRGNAIAELDGRPALEALEAVYAGLPEADQRLFRRALFLGVVMRPDRMEYRQGDFLIRNILGLQADTRALLVGARVEPNQVVQLHVRDAATSAADLDALLGRHAQAHPDAPAAGALMFACLGRGAGLYGAPDHDAQAVAAHLGPDVALGGFFCNGEIGPVQDATFLHGYTSVLGVFRPRHREPQE